MDMLYTAAVLESDGISVKVIDAIGGRMKGREVATSMPDAKAIGIRMSLPSLDSDIRLVNDIKRSRPGTTVFGFGPVIRHTYKDWIAGFEGDFLLFGEPEAVALDALRAQDFRSCKGILYIEGGQARVTSDWVYCESLDALPYPAWHLIKLKDYAFRREVKNFTFYVLSSRGCPNMCNMCPYPVHHGRKWRSRNPRNVLEELIYLKKRFGAVNIQFRDPNFGINKKRLQEVCRLIVDSGLTWRWSCEVDLQNLDDDIVGLMAKAGCARIMTGVESSDSAALGDIGQDAGAIPRIERMIGACKERNIDLTGFYIVGFPSETWGSVGKTLDYAKKVRTRSVVSIMTPYHGTGLREEVAKEGLLKEGARFDAYDGFNCILRTRAMDYEDVELAWRYVSSELDYINSELMFKKYGDVRKLGALVKMAENRVRYLPVRMKAQKKMGKA